MGWRVVSVFLAIGLSACGVAATGGQPSATLQPCQSFDARPQNVGSEIQHLKTSASVVQVTSSCTVRTG